MKLESYLSSMDGVIRSRDRTGYGPGDDVTDENVADWILDHTDVTSALLQPKVGHVA